LKTRSRVAYRQADTICFISLRSDDDLSRTIVYGSHRIRGIGQQVEDDLLKLHPIADDPWKVVGKLRPHIHAISLELTG
jgi:hypothetical protein